MTRIVSQAVAKVNLVLNVSGRNTDDLHEMQSVFVFLNDIFDVLIIDTGHDFCEQSGKIPGVPQQDNSIKKAAEILENTFGRKCPQVEVVKNLPIAGGVGGGSSDAACYINTVLDIWGFSSAAKMDVINEFRPLGADATVFLYKYFTNSGTLFLDGTGLDGTITQLNIENIADHHILLINDGTRIETKLVFEHHDSTFSKKIYIDECRDINNIKKFKNSLEPATLALAPHLANALQDLCNTNPLMSGISGSGASCFGLYSSHNEAQKAMSSLCTYRFVAISKIS